MEPLNSDCRAALDIAKRTLGRKDKLDAPLLMAALYFHTELKDSLPELAAYLDVPNPRTERAPEKVPVADALKPVLGSILQSSHAVEPPELLAALLTSEPGRRYLTNRGMPASELDAARIRLEKKDARPPSDNREEVVKALSPFGRMLTAVDLPAGSLVDIEIPLKALIRNLTKFKRRNVIVLGHPGTGKSVLVYELARRLSSGDTRIPPPLRGKDIFELSPAFLRSGASVVGQYEERVKGLLQVLEAHPEVILFVDEIHSFFQSGVHMRGPFTDANEAFKGMLGRGEITCVGCTTPSEYRHYIEPDEALARRFNILRLDPPSTETTIRILEARLPKLSAYYAPLQVPEGIIRRVVELTEEYLPGRYQPDKSIQLLDEACAYCATAEPPEPELTEEALKQALEDMAGHGIVRTDRLHESDVYDRLRSKITGQDSTLREIAKAFVAALGDWRKGDHPRAVFLFAGPTGVGKTETAVLLSRILGGGEGEQLIRVDCNTLQGAGRDSGPTINRLLGVPPGYLGYARGQGGLLSKIRDWPESIVLFDELEKADPGVGEILLRIMDEGWVEDVDGNRLDFRRSFLIFSTNVGSTYDCRGIGFGETAESGGFSPRVDEEGLANGLRMAGFGEEFLGRVTHRFLFQGLSQKAVREILVARLKVLREASEVRGLRLEWSPEVVEHLAQQWQPRFGVRHLIIILRNRISEQLAVAEAQGELDGLTNIRLGLMSTSAMDVSAELSGTAVRRREGDSLLIDLL